MAGPVPRFPFLERQVSEQVAHDRRRLLGVGALALAGAWLGTRASVRRAIAAPFSWSDGHELRSLDHATGWLNSPPLTEAALRGKVVLINFWTLTCINWIRQMPYVRAWAEKYKDRGLVVIGVHSPEFGFEKQVDGIRLAVTDRRITYPVAIDSDHAIWRGFHNDYWPALYFVDAQGQVRHEQFGEGKYEQCEAWIQQLLAGAGAGGVGSGLVQVDPRGAEIAADWPHLKSPENYLGYDRTRHFSSPGGVAEDQRHVYTAPSRLRLNEWALSGEWTVGREAIASNRAGARILYGFHGRDLHLVMRPGAGSRTIPFRVRLDGGPPGAAHGTDVDPDGMGALTQGRLYQLIRQTAGIADRQFDIEFLDAGVEAFSFTFG
jgi:thiol-disulfide isomerase/thioredoxin